MKDTDPFAKELFGAVVIAGIMREFIQPLPDMSNGPFGSTEEVAHTLIGNTDACTIQMAPRELGRFFFPFIGIDRRRKDEIFIQFMKGFTGTVTVGETTYDLAKLQRTNRRFASLTDSSKCVRHRWQGLRLWRLRLIPRYERGEVNGNIAFDDITVEFSLKDHDVEVHKPISGGIRPSCHHPRYRA